MLPVRVIPRPIHVGKHTIDFEHRTLVMGVLNVTPDSFSDGGRHFARQHAVDAALRMIDEGADIIDVGGESTRPGAPPVPIDEELRRVVPVIEALSQRGVGLISVDTRKAAVANAAIDAGAGIINDVTAMSGDPEMVSVAAKRGAAVVLMHMRGDPTTMQQGEIVYDDVVEDVARYLEAAAERVARGGVLSNRIMLDPGFGFGKTVQHNLQLMVGVERFARRGHAVVWGPSRKSTLGQLTGGLPASERLFASVAACVMAVDRGAHMVRVHDVAAVRQAVAIVDAARGAFIA